MKLIYILLLITFSTFDVWGQQIDLLTTLQDSIKETSGLIYLNNKLITHNDSGGGPFLFEIDSVSGNVTRKVVVSKATNIDWEDLCCDDTYIYIADFGNNNGSRTDLKIYRLLISDYLTAINDTVIVDTINFHYSDQTDFDPGPYSTNFDAEALISYNDSLYIFTKNWGNNWTNIYALPKTPGTYEIKKTDSVNSNGLVTGATFISESNTILLSGYLNIFPFIIKISDFSLSNFSGGKIERFPIGIPSGSSTQIEAITTVARNQCYITAEENFTGNAALYKLNTDNLLGFDSIDVNTNIIYPNPANNVVNINYSNLSVVEIYDLRGALQKTSTNEQIYISDLSKGIYLVVIKNIEGEKVDTKKLIIN
ncbi:MAG: T9SS type A sorting domain-containing protein [Prolixibacteraceae bacterium]|jgi:hypothetical protein|nr:T9SS type A sorting domain-containing protein [Prolixibacteraceae bacterium]MBT6765661.1 T9SS type A sorting domain-containing protein [Prolixibacteraceae bacterium]MBT6998470.1 T9SS type A sorting domain-containing protein [Prolixibacteraceae bacterium]MBT7397111.1 T9SS type A sorting domain-containing protein [Prolixibacteraceae bacterium]